MRQNKELEPLLRIAGRRDRSAFDHQHHRAFQSTGPVNLSFRHGIALVWFQRDRRAIIQIDQQFALNDGVCGLLIAEKLGISQPTLSEHMKLLVQAGLVRPKRIKQWIFYRRDEDRIKTIKAEMMSDL